MNLQKYITSFLCGSNDCYPHPSSNDPQTGCYIPLTSQPPPPLPMRVLPLSLTNRDYRTAQEIHTLLLQAPLRNPPDLTTDITATFGLPPEAYTPRLAEYLVLALETTVEAAPTYDWYRARDKGFGDAYWAAREAARDFLQGAWHVADVEWDETGRYASKPARIVKTLLALGILVRMAPGFTRVLGFESGGGAEGEKPVFFRVVGDILGVVDDSRYYPARAAVVILKQDALIGADMRLEVWVSTVYASRKAHRPRKRKIIKLVAFTGGPPA